MFWVWCCDWVSFWLFFVCFSFLTGGGPWLFDFGPWVFLGLPGFPSGSWSDSGLLFWFILTPRCFFSCREWWKFVLGEGPVFALAFGLLSGVDGVALYSVLCSDVSDLFARLSAISARSFSRSALACSFLKLFPMFSFCLFIFLFCFGSFFSKFI